MPRFVVLQHDTPRGRHWDFMLETGDVLATWALDAPPDAGTAVSAAALPDHRPAYLDYEGPISGDRGSVAQWDGGTYELVDSDDTRWAVQLAGRRLVGRATLVRVADEPNRWHFEFVRRDGMARE